MTPSLAPISKTLGNSAGSTDIALDCTGKNSAAPCAVSVSDVRVPRSGDGQSTGAPPTRPNGFTPTIFKNKVWWFGAPNPTPPPGVRGNGPILTFTPLDRIPGFLQPLWGFFTRNINFQACVLGVSVTIGPYGTRTVSLNRGCA